jgi:hypothetical protein
MIHSLKKKILGLLNQIAHMHGQVLSASALPRTSLLFPRAHSYQTSAPYILSPGSDPPGYPDSFECRTLRSLHFSVSVSASDPGKLYSPCPDLCS